MDTALNNPLDSALATFDYQTAFTRNIGWVTPTEQAFLRSRRIAIAGLGGVGGSHLLTLARLGIGAFNLADFDRFELHNFNRQVGASFPHVGKPKLEVMMTLAQEINPELMICAFPEGINADNMDSFLDGVDLYVDGLDFFTVAIRRQVFAACAERGIPAITAAPLGLGVALLNFLPGRMTFEDYFRLEGQPLEEQLLRFFLGLAPQRLQQVYLLDPSTINFHTQRGPSISLACDLCAGAAAAQALKILLQRGKVVAAPRGLQFDAYRNRLAYTWLPGGMANPLQQVKLWLARRQFAKVQNQTPPQPDTSPGEAVIHQILDLARWAPSGDNTQPWRFAIKADDHLVVQGFDTRDRVVYDLEGRASQTALGALLETIDIAARAKGLQCTVQRRMDAPEVTPTFDVYFHATTVQPSPYEWQLAQVIRARCTQRRRLSRRRLNDQQRARFAEAVGDDYVVVWLEGQPTLRKVAQLLFRNAHVRLTMPEAYPVHRDIIQWHAQYSPDRIPEQAIGLDPLTTRLMQWTLASWQRVAFMNRYLGGTLLPRLQLDVWPALNCAAHFVVVSRSCLDTIDDYVAGGRAMQRFWLTATALGLQYQPEMTPLIFASYVNHGVEFTKQPRCVENARRVTEQLAGLIGKKASQRAVCMGRVGFGPAPVARSTRLPLNDLLISE